MFSKRAAAHRARLWFVVNVSYCVTVLNKQGSRPLRRALHLHNNKHINSEAHSDESATMTDVVTSTKTEWLDDKNNSCCSGITPVPETALLNMPNDVTDKIIGNYYGMTLNPKGGVLRLNLFWLWTLYFGSFVSRETGSAKCNEKFYL